MIMAKHSCQLLRVYIHRTVLGSGWQRRWYTSWYASQLGSIVVSVAGVNTIGTLVSKLGDHDGFVQQEAADFNTCK